MTHQLSFIGGGNMARSLIGGLLARGWSHERMCVSDPVASQRSALEESFGVRTTTDNLNAVRGAKTVVLAVKPQDMRAVGLELAPALAAEHPLVISVAAGVRAADLQRWLGDLPIVRAMPNRPALLGCGITGLYAAPSVSEAVRTRATEILAAVGPAIWVAEEAQMDVVTAVSGSGPAYFFLLIEMLEAAAQAQGLPSQVSRQLAVETAYGAGFMARAATETPAQLRQQVTSKGGTTEAALAVLERRGIRDIFAEAIAAAARRSAELAAQLGQQ